MYSQIINQSLRNRYFLDKMGINCWAVSDKHCHNNKNLTNQIITLDDGWQAMILSFKKSDSLTISDFQNSITQDVPDNKIDKAADNPIIDPTLLTALADAHLDDINNDDIAPHQKNILPILPELLVGVAMTMPNFDMVGVRYQDWLILADNKKMDTVQLSIWQSLTEKLAIKARQENYTFIKSTLFFPFNADWVLEAGEQELAVSAFLWRLFGNKQPTKMAVLTELTMLSFDDDFAIKQQKTPTLLEMVMDAEHKKVLWRLLHS